MGNSVCCKAVPYLNCEKIKTKIFGSCNSKCCVTLDNHQELNLTMVLCDHCKNKLVRHLSESIIIMGQNK